MRGNQRQVDGGGDQVEEMDEEFAASDDDQEVEEEAPLAVAADGHLSEDEEEQRDPPEEVVDGSPPPPERRSRVRRLPRPMLRVPLAPWPRRGGRLMQMVRAAQPWAAQRREEARGGLGQPLADAALEERVRAEVERHVAQALGRTSAQAATPPSVAPPTRCMGRAGKRRRNWLVG